MKKLPFYNPASPWFFHLAVLLLYILILTVFLISAFLFPITFFTIAIYIATVFFSFIYPFLVLVAATTVRKYYLKIYQVIPPEKFANKLIFYNRILMSFIYATPFLFLISEFTNRSGGPYYIWATFFLLFCFFVFLFPLFIRIYLLNKTNYRDWLIVVGTFILFMILILLIAWFIGNLHFS